MIQYRPFLVRPSTEACNEFSNIAARGIYLSGSFVRALQQATTAAAALDCAITYSCTAWGLTTWLFMPVARDAGLRRQLARAADRGMATIDVEVFGAILCERCPDLELCAALAADPSKLAVQSTGAGWLLLFLEDGEATPIGTAAA